MLTRMIAFIRGDMAAAEDLTGYPKHVTPAIVTRAMTDAPLGEYIVGIAAETRDRTDNVLTSIQSRAGSYLTLLVGLLPLSIAAIAIALPAKGSSPAAWIGFALLVVASVILVSSAIAAALATGFGPTATANLDFMEEAGDPKTMPQLKADMADTWNYAAILNMENARRRTLDLFRARQLTVIALAITLVGFTAVVVANGGLPATLNTTPTPSSSVAPGPTPS